jgi:type I restriction enzyme, S subunit
MPRNRDLPCADCGKLMWRGKQSLPPGRARCPEVPDGVPYVRQQDVAEGTVRVDQLARTSPEIANRYRRTALRSGDVLLCIIRNLRVAIVPMGIDGANITQGMVRIRPRGDVLAGYLSLYLESPNAQRWMKDRYIGLAMPRINVRDAREIPIPVPPIGEQHEIVRRANKLLELADVVRHRFDDALLRLERSSEAVLIKALRGEFVQARFSDFEADAGRSV